MFVTYITNVILWLTIFSPLTSSLGTVAKKTKLCGDEACSEKLFEGKFHRSSEATHDSFLSPNENDIVSVYAIKFSDRTDLMEGALLNEPARRGNFYSTHINLDSYVEFLKNAVVSNKTMFMISRDPHDQLTPRLVGVKAAIPELIKDYEVNAQRLANERQLPSPEKIDYAALGYVPNVRGHGHSHSHGYSHDHGHMHSHDHNIHQHLPNEQNLQQPVVPSTEPIVPQPPVVNVPTNAPQEVSTGSSTVNPVEQQKMQNAHLTNSNIPVQQNTIANPASHVSPSDPSVTSNSIPNAPGSPPVTELKEATGMLENQPQIDVNDINFAGKIDGDRLIQQSSEQSLPLADVVDAKMQAESIQPIVMQSVEEPVKHANFHKSPTQAVNISPSASVPESNTPAATPVKMSQTNLPSPAPAISLPNPPPPTPVKMSQTNLPSPAPAISLQNPPPPSPPPVPPAPSPVPPSLPVPSDATPPSGPVYASPPPPPPQPLPAFNEQPIPQSTISVNIELPDSSTASGEIRTSQDIPPTATPTNIKPSTDTTTISPMNQATAQSPEPITSIPDAIKSLPDHVTKMEYKSESDKKNPETTITNLPHEPSSSSSSSSSVISQPQPNVASSHVPNPSEGISHDEMVVSENPKVETSNEPKIVNAEAQVNGEIKTDIMEEDGLGYCIKGGCNKIYNSPVAEEEIQTGGLLMIGKWLGRLIGIVRYVLPLSLNTIDDAGVLVTFFVPICLLIHLLRVLIFADTSEKDTFDRRTLHNALTAIRQREIQIKLLQAEAEKGKNVMNAENDKKYGNLQMEISDRLLEIQQLKAKYRMLEEENDKMKMEMEERSKTVERECLKNRDLMEQNKKLEEKNELLTKQLSEMHAAMEISREKNERLDDELTRKKAQLTQLESEANSYSLEIKNLKDQLKTSLAESKMLHQRVEELQNETVQLSEIVSEMRDMHNDIIGDRSSVAQVEKNEKIREERNGANGWSDIEELDVDSVVAEKSKKEHSPVVRFSPTDIMEVARLRAQLKNVEADLDQARLTLQKHENEREHLLRKVKFAESDAAKRLQEVEIKEAERIEAHNQFKRILAMMEEREAKLRNTEELTEKLRDEVAKWQEQVRHLEDQKKTVELKLVEADQELKRLKAEYTRLETRNFHEVRECKQTIAALQQSLEQFRLSNPSTNMHDNANLLNLSASSSDRDYGASLSGGLVAPLLTHVRPLWGDEPSEMPLLRRTDQPLNDLTPENGNINLKRGSRSRRSNRDREHNNGTDADGIQSRHKKEGRRMRSRSQGRHPLQTDYFPNMGMPPYVIPPVDYYNNSMLNKQHSKSGTLYYSSGGSNDGRSPPPEIALLSGIPPPGPMIKKPTPRPKSSAEPVERRQN